MDSPEAVDLVRLGSGGGEQAEGQVARRATLARQSERLTLRQQTGSWRQEPRVELGRARRVGERATLQAELLPVPGPQQVEAGPIGISRLAQLGQKPLDLGEARRDPAVRRQELGLRPLDQQVDPFGMRAQGVRGLPEEVQGTLQLVPFARDPSEPPEGAGAVLGRHHRQRLLDREGTAQLLRRQVELASRPVQKSDAGTYRGSSLGGGLAPVERVAVGGLRAPQVAELALHLGDVDQHLGVAPVGRAVGAADERQGLTVAGDRSFEVADEVALPTDRPHRGGGQVAMGRAEQHRPHLERALEIESGLVQAALEHAPVSPVVEGARDLRMPGRVHATADVDALLPDRRRLGDELRPLEQDGDVVDRLGEDRVLDALHEPDPHRPQADSQRQVVLRTEPELVHSAAAQARDPLQRIAHRPAGGGAVVEHSPTPGPLRGAGSERLTAGRHRVGHADHQVGDPTALRSRGLDPRGPRLLEALERLRQSLAPRQRRAVLRGIARAAVVALLRQQRALAHETCRQGRRVRLIAADLDRPPREGLRDAGPLTQQVVRLRQKIQRVRQQRRVGRDLRFGPGDEGLGRPIGRRPAALGQQLPAVGHGLRQRPAQWIRFEAGGSGLGGARRQDQGQRQGQNEGDESDRPATSVPP